VHQLADPGHYNRLEEAKTVVILVHQLADRTYKEIDPDKKAPLLVQWPALLELRQLARAICRARQVEDEHEAESGCLFDFALQPRYPARHDGCEAYVLRDHLTLAERRDNITRLRHESAAKIQHADALEPDAQQRKVLPHYIRERIAPLASPLDRFAHGRAIEQGTDRGMDQRLRHR
jgi:hypothetical protein